MLFNSYSFIFLYLPLTLAVFALLSRRHRPTAIVFLGAASLFFYGWWDWRYTFLLCSSILVNYFLGALMAGLEGRRRKLVLILGLSFNLGLLAVFKYADLILHTLAAAHIVPLWSVSIVLPLGISFFSFTQIAFLCDVYRRIAIEFNFSKYFLFVTYFPHLIAGPILHHKEMMPQFGRDNVGRLRGEDVAPGLAMFAIGLSKKVLLADNFSAFANSGFDAAQSGHYPDVIAAWVAVLAYTMQIYFDFSGYSDMAIGLSKLFGIKLPLNFDSPYKSVSIIEFWRRWHMTLSRFLRDYLYIPLGGNRKGPVRRMVNLLATMLLGGLWHGANWTFVIWGALHGLYLVVNHIWRRFFPEREAASRVSVVLGWSLTTLAVMVAWVFFRAPSLSSALRVLMGMVGLNGILLPAKLTSILHLGPAQMRPDTFGFDQMPLGNLPLFLAAALAGGIALTMPNSHTLLSKYAPALESQSRDGIGLTLSRRMGLVFGVLISVCLMQLNHKTQFLYFQF